MFYLNYQTIPLLPRRAPFTPIYLECSIIFVFLPQFTGFHIFLTPSQSRKLDCRVKFMTMKWKQSKTRGALMKTTHNSGDSGSSKIYGGFALFIEALSLQLLWKAVPLIQPSTFCSLLVQSLLVQTSWQAEAPRCQGQGCPWWWAGNKGRTEGIIQEEELGAMETVQMKNHKEAISGLCSHGRWGRGTAVGKPASLGHWGQQEADIKNECWRLCSQNQDLLNGASFSPEHCKRDHEGDQVNLNNTKCSSSYSR